MPTRLFLTLCLLIGSQAHAQETSQSLSSRAAITEQTEVFMMNLADSNTVGAYQSIRPFLGVPVKAFDGAASDAATYFQQVTERAGNPVSYSRVGAESIADDFHRVVWLQKFAAAAIAWTFTFYQPDDGWKLVGVSYSTDIDALYRDD